MIDLEKFTSKIKLSEDVKEHLKDTTQDFEEYLKKLVQYNNSAIEIFLYDMLVKENVDSSKLERELFSPKVIEAYELLFVEDTKITEEKLFKIHKAIMDNNTVEHRTGGKYREHQVWIGNPNEGIENAFHVPPIPSEIKDYMRQFIDYYNNNNDFDDPFIMSSIIHVLMIKIHPYADGNGRMARVLQNHKLKSIVNKKYGLQLKYPPLNISKSYDLTRLTYFKKQNAIKFDLETDNSEAFNNWISYVLTMFDEQIYFARNRLETYDMLLKSDITKNFKDKK